MFQQPQVAINSASRLPEWVCKRFTSSFAVLHSEHVRTRPASGRGRCHARRAIVVGAKRHRQFSCEFSGLKTWRGPEDYKPHLEKSAKIGAKIGGKSGTVAVGDFCRTPSLGCGLLGDGDKCIVCRDCTGLPESCAVGWLRTHGRR